MDEGNTCRRMWEKEEDDIVDEVRRGEKRTGKVEENKQEKDRGLREGKAGRQRK